MRRHEIRIEASYLTHCSPEATYNWLNEHRSKERPNFYNDADERILEYILYRRRHPLVDLGIARFGAAPQIVRAVYLRGDLGVRCAALANSTAGLQGVMSRAWMTGDDLHHLVQFGSIAELSALATNPHLDDDFLINLITRNSYFSDLSDSRYRSILLSLGSNPRMSQGYDDTWLDGYREHSYNRVFSACWELARSLPADQRWAFVLSVLLEKTHPPVGFDGLHDVIERWRIDRARKSDESFHVPDHSFYLRSRLADLLPATENLKESTDLALRLSFYRRFSPFEFRDWPSFLERDGAEFVEAALENSKLWRTAEERERLSQIAWDSPDPYHDMDMPNIFRAKERRLRGEHPRWFQNEDDESSNEPDAAVRRMEKELKCIRTIVEDVKLAIRSG